MPLSVIPDALPVVRVRFPPTLVARDAADVPSAMAVVPLSRVASPPEPVVFKVMVSVPVPSPSVDVPREISAFVAVVRKDEVPLTVNAPLSVIPVALLLAAIKSPSIVEFPKSNAAPEPALIVTSPAVSVPASLVVISKAPVNA